MNGLDGIAPADVTTTFLFLSGTQAGNASAEPFQGAKGDRFQITVTIPFNKVRWINIGIVNPSTVSFTVNWTMLVDEPFTIDPALPSW